MELALKERRVLDFKPRPTSLGTQSFHLAGPGGGLHIGPGPCGCSPSPTVRRPSSRELLGNLRCRPGVIRCLDTENNAEGSWPTSAFALFWLWLCSTGCYRWDHWLCKSRQCAKPGRRAPLRELSRPGCLPAVSGPQERLGFPRYVLLFSVRQFWNYYLRHQEARSGGVWLTWNPKQFLLPLPRGIAQWGTGLVSVDGLYVGHGRVFVPREVSFDLYPARTSPLAAELVHCRRLPVCYENNMQRCGLCIRGAFQQN